MAKKNGFRYSKETKIKALALYLNGTKADDISKIVGATRSTIINWINNFKKNEYKITEDDVFFLNKNIKSIKLKELSPQTIVDIITIRGVVTKIISKINDEYETATMDKTKILLESLMLANNYLLNTNTVEQAAKENRIIVEVVGNESKS